MGCGVDCSVRDIIVYFHWLKFPVRYSSCEKKTSSRKKSWFLISRHSFVFQSWLYQFQKPVIADILSLAFSLCHRFRTCAPQVNWNFQDARPNLHSLDASDAIEQFVGNGELPIGSLRPVLVIRKQITNTTSKHFHQDRRRKDSWYRSWMRAHLFLRMKHSLPQLFIYLSLEQAEEIHHQKLLI